MTAQYQQLLQDCKEIITEFGFTHRWALIELYWSLGKRIVNEDPVTVTETIGNLSKDLGKSERTIQRSVQFFKMYPDLNMLPEGKNTSWHNIVNKYLPEPKEVKKEEEVLYTCPNCNFKFTKEDL